MLCVSRAVNYARAVILTVQENYEQGVRARCIGGGNASAYVQERSLRKLCAAWVVSVAIKFQRKSALIKEEPTKLIFSSKIEKAPKLSSKSALKYKCWRVNNYYGVEDSEVSCAAAVTRVQGHHLTGD